MPLHTLALTPSWWAGDSRAFPGPRGSGSCAHAWLDSLEVWPGGVAVEVWPLLFFLASQRSHPITFHIVKNNPGPVREQSQYHICPESLGASLPTRCVAGANVAYGRAGCVPRARAWRSWPRLAGEQNAAGAWCPPPLHPSSAARAARMMGCCC